MVRRAATFTVKTGHWQNTSRRKPEQLNINPWIRSVSSWKKVYKKRNFIWGQNAAGRCVSVSDVCGDAARSRSRVIIFSRRPLLWCPPFRDLPHCVRHIPLRLRGGAHVYLTATKTWYHLKRFSGTKWHNIHVWFYLKRFPGTVCDENGCGLYIPEHIHSLK